VAAAPEEPRVRAAGALRMPQAPVNDRRANVEAVVVALRGDRG